jgi:catalase
VKVTTAVSPNTRGVSARLTTGVAPLAKRPTLTTRAPVAEPTTTDAGIPVSSDEFSLTVGPDGPILLQDHYLIEQMANFNRERVPERQPHAKGSGAFGHFEVTQDVSKYTKAALLQPGTKTDMLARFSTCSAWPCRRAVEM